MEQRGKGRSVPGLELILMASVLSLKLSVLFSYL